MNSSCRSAAEKSPKPKCLRACRRMYAPKWRGALWRVAWRRRAFTFSETGSPMRAGVHLRRFHVGPTWSRNSPGRPLRDAADLQIKLALLRIGEVAEFAVQ